MRLVLCAVRSCFLVIAVTGFLIGLALGGCVERALPIGGAAVPESNDGGRDGGHARGPAGAACSTACDCEPGLGCFQGRCAVGNIGSIYCCDEGACPFGHFCQRPNGTFSSCP